MHPDIFTYDETLEKLADVEEWLERYKISGKGRLNETIKFLTAARDAWKEDRGAEFIDSAEKFERFVNVFSQAVEFVMIHEAHKDCEDEALPGKLEKIVKGSLILAEEKTTGAASLGRNTMFELVLSAMFRKRHEVPVVLEDPSDLTVSYDDREFLVECKRPQTFDGVDRNIKRARDQLRKRLSRCPGARGVIGLSLSKLLNPGDRLINVENREQLSPALIEIARAVTSDLRPKIIKVSEKKIVGFVLHLGMPALLTKISPLPVHCTQSVFYGLGEREDLARRQFIALGKSDSRGFIDA